MEADKRPRMQLEDTSEMSNRNPSVVDDVHLTILKELDGLVEIRKFKERDSRISALLQLWVALFSNPNKSDYIAEAFLTLFRKTTVAILSPDWMSVTLTLKEKLVNAIDIAGQSLSSSIEDSLHLCNMLHRTALEPWKHKSWKHILDGNADIDDQHVQHCLAAEPEDLLLSRVQFLAHSGCERQAMSLAKCCFKFFNRYKKNSWCTRSFNPIRFKERQGSKIANYCGFSSVEWFLFLLQKKNKLSEIVKETSSLTCDEGVKLIQFLRRKSSSTNPLLLALTNIFLVRDFMFPSKYCCTKDLIVLWVSLYEKRKMSEIADAVRKLLVSYASTSAHFYLFVDVLWEQFGSKLLSLYVEMYVRGLTADVNFLEVARSNELRETVQEMETHISNMWHKLSTLFDEGSEEVARECMLSAFSMRPNKERLYILQSLTHSILSESQLRACSREEGEGATSRQESERCGNRNCRCGVTCLSDAEHNSSAAAEANQSSAAMHPLLRRGMKGISYSCVRDLVSLLECVRCKTFQFNCFDWHKRSSELGDYLKTHTARFEDVSFLKAHVGDFNMLFRQTPDDMDTESPSDEDMDYESSSNKICGNFPTVSSEGISVHQTVPFKLEQTTSSVWAHSKLEPVPPQKVNPMFPENNFIQKAAAVTKHPTHICRSSKSTSFNPFIKSSSLGTNPSMAKEMLARSNSLSSGVGKMHLPHLNRHSVTPVPSPCGGSMTVASATEAMLRSVIVNNSPVSDDYRNKSSPSFLAHKNGGMNFPFTVTAPSNITRESPAASLHSPSSNPCPHEVLNSHLKSSEPINASTHTKHHFHSTVSSSIHQSKPLSSCMSNEAFASRSDASTSIQNILRTVNISNSAFPQRLNSLTNDLEASMSGSKVHGLASPSYVQKGNVHSDISEGLHQSKSASTAVSSDTSGNMLMTLLESQKDDLTTNSFTPSALNLTKHKRTDRMSSDGLTDTRNSCSPLNSLLEAKTKDQFSEHTALKVDMQEPSFMRHADSSDMQVCSRIPIPVSINTIPIGTVEQLSNHDSKTSLPAFKISMPPDMVNPFKNWFVPANLVIPKNSNPNASDPLSECSANYDYLLDRSAKSTDSNVISIPGYIVFKSNKGKCLSSPRKAKGAVEEAGNAVQKKIWTSYRSSFGGVSCRKTSIDTSAPAPKTDSEKYPSASVQESAKNNGQRCFQNTSGPSSSKSLYSVHAHDILNAQHESSQFYVHTSKSDSPLPSSHGEPSVATASKAFSPESAASHHQTSPLSSSVPHVISVLGKDMHPSFPTCSERKIPPLNMSISSSDIHPLTDPQNSKMERLGSLTVSTDKMCCSENEVVPCQSCSLSAAQAHQNEQSLKTGLSQRRDVAGIKPSGTSNMVKTFYN